VEKFGVDRVMFASNFPMDKNGCSYTCLWNAYKLMTAHLPMADREKLFHDNAVKSATATATATATAMLSAQPCPPSCACVRVCVCACVRVCACAVIDGD
jgi:hypothetical protein